MEVLKQASECAIEGSESVSLVCLGLRFPARSDGSRSRVVNMGTEFNLAVNVAGADPTLASKGGLDTSMRRPGGLPGGLRAGLEEAGAFASWQL